MSDANDQQIVFVQYHEPGLKAGAYRVHVEVSVQATPPQTFQPVQKRFEVKGDRYALTSGIVDSVYPPEDTSGDFSAVLPHIVLKTSTLPWQRTLDATATDYTPWLALIVLSDDELKAAGLTADPPWVSTVKTDGLTEVPCKTLTLPADVWGRVAPRRDEMPYLAHVRKVGTRRKVDNTLDEVEFALVVGNRLPPGNHSCRAFLVSLEGLADRLPPTAGTAPVELVVLWTWRFFAVLETRTFAEVIAGLDRSPAALCLPHDAGNAKPADAALSMGFVPVAHDLRVGGATVSWYRGPLVPYGTSRKIEKLPVEWADAVTFYDPVLGLMDVSCSSAWTLGRLLALNDSTFAAGLYKWKRGVQRDTIDRVEYELLNGRPAPRGALMKAARATNDTSLAGGLREALAELGALKRPVMLAARNEVDLEIPEPPSQEETAVQLRDAMRDPARIARLHHVATGLLATAHAAAPAPPDDEKRLWDWLGERMVLKGVPLHYLVPDPRMLPPESIRFFQIDLSWMEALIDGAFSLGRVTASDRSHDHAFTRVFDTGASRAASLVRPQNRQLLRSQNAAPPLVKPRSGFLMRSSAVQHWPGIEVDGRNAAGAATIVRQEAMETILLCLFDRVVDTVSIHQPSEGVHFGFHQVAGSLVKHRRRTHDEGDKKAGSEIEADPVTTIPYRTTGSGVLDVVQLAGLLHPAADTSPFTSAGFALQMVTGVDRVTFQIS